jgi:hypothetical protein
VSTSWADPMAPTAAVEPDIRVPRHRKRGNDTDQCGSLGRETNDTAGR